MRRQLLCPRVWRETGGEDPSSSSRPQLFVIDFEDSNITASPRSPLTWRGVPVRVSDYLQHWQHHIVQLSAGVWRCWSSLPLPTQDLSILPRHLIDPRLCSTPGDVLGTVLRTVSTAAAWHSRGGVLLTEISAVSCPHQYCRSGGSGEQGDGTVVLGLSARAPQGTNPGVAMTGVGEG